MAAPPPLMGTVHCGKEIENHDPQGANPSAEESSLSDPKHLWVPVPIGFLFICFMYYFSLSKFQKEYVIVFAINLINNINV